MQRVTEEPGWTLPRQFWNHNFLQWCVWIQQEPVFVFKVMKNRYNTLDMSWKNHQQRHFEIFPTCQVEAGTIHFINIQYHE